LRGGGAGGTATTGGTGAGGGVLAQPATNAAPAAPNHARRDGLYSSQEYKDENKVVFMMKGFS